MKVLLIIFLFVGIAKAGEQKVDPDVLGKWLCISGAETKWNTEENYPSSDFKNKKYMLYIWEFDGKTRLDFGPYEIEPTTYGVAHIFRGVYSGHYDRLNQSIYYEPARKRFVHTYVNSYLNKSSQDDMVIIRGNCELL